MVSINLSFRVADIVLWMPKREVLMSLNGMSPVQA